MAVNWSDVDALADEASVRAAEIEDAGRPPDDLLARVVQGGLFCSGVPSQWGGLGATPAESFQIARRIAAGDGSLGWLVAATSFFHNIVAAVGDPALKDLFFSDPGAYLSGGVAGSGTATPTNDGYEVDGCWAFSSGCWGATWLGGLCLLSESSGTHPPGLLWVVVPADRGKIRASWDVAGLRGTGSDTVVLPRQRVPAEWTFPLPVPLDYPATTDHPIACSARGLWPTAFAVAATQLGIARRALDEAAIFARTKTRPRAAGPLIEEQAFVRELTQAEATWQSANLAAECELAALWAGAVAGEPLDLTTRLRARLLATHAAQVGASIVRTCFDLAGATASADSTRWPAVIATGRSFLTTPPPTRTPSSSSALWVWALRATRLSSSQI